MKWSVFLVSILCLSMQSALAEFRQSPADKAALEELARRCTMESQNEAHTTQLLTGRLLQTRFKGEKIASCISTLEKPCERKDWYPAEFVGILYQTNRHAPADKVFFTTSGFSPEDQHKLDFILGRFYAFCAEVQPRPSPQYPPNYIIYDYQTIYELTATQ